MIHHQELLSRTLPAEFSYIRSIKTIPTAPKDKNQDLYRIIICMTQEMSRNLAQAHYIQCDISYKRIVGWLEFEIAGWNRELKCGACIHHLRHAKARTGLDSR